MHSLFSRALAEFIGVFTLVVAGVMAIATLVPVGTGEGAALLGDTDGAAALIGVALAHGLAIAVMVTAIGHVSGGHLNPAVTIALLVNRKTDSVSAFTYIVAQVLGAAAGAAVAKAALPSARWESISGGVPTLNEIGVGSGVLLEAVMTFFLVWVVFAVAVDADGAFTKVAGLPIGFVIVMDILFGGSLTGAAMNPARELGPALLAGVWTDWWVYWVGPILGGIAAGFAYNFGIRPKSAA